MTCLGSIPYAIRKQSGKSSSFSSLSLSCRAVVRINNVYVKNNLSFLEEEWLWINISRKTSALRLWAEWYWQFVILDFSITSKTSFTTLFWIVLHMNHITPRGAKSGKGCKALVPFLCHFAGLPWAVATTTTVEIPTVSLTNQCSVIQVLENWKFYLPTYIVSNFYFIYLCSLLSYVKSIM